VRRPTAFEWNWVILGGLPLALPIILLLGEQRLAVASPISLYFWMSTLISAPHVYSTYLRLGRKIHEGQVPTWIGWPAYLACAAALAVATLGARYAEAMTAVNVVQSFHYVRQGYGVSRLYTRDAGDDALGTRLLFLAFHLAMPLFVIGRWHNLWLVWKGARSQYIIPVGFPAPVLAACWALAGVGLLAGIAGEGRRWWRQGRSYRPLGVALLAIFYAIHTYGFLSVTSYQRGFFAVTIFHAVQYLALLWMLEREQASAAVRWVATLVRGAFGLVPFWGAITLVVLGFEWRVLPVLDRWVWVSMSSVLLGAMSAHHYAADAMIWRARAGR